MRADHTLRVGADLGDYRIDAVVETALDQSAATLNVDAFALFQVAILLPGCWPVLTRPRDPGTPEPKAAVRAAVAA